MCGLTGFFDSTHGRPADRDLLVRMTTTLVHRGPDSEGYFVEVKSRTWSRRDAEDKAAVITQLVERLGAGSGDLIEADYVDL